ncbi:MAG: hypothetical protein FWH54_06030 [Methanobrevibacter sp.]|nr:hypothetical protein [Methanobrevibacter sp.]
MFKKKFVVILLLIVFMICVACNVLQTVSATKYHVVEENTAPVKDSNLTNLHWKVYSSDKQLKISKEYIKGNSTVLIKKISIKKFNSKLKINNEYFYKNVTTEKNSSVKSKLSLKSFYLKVYKPKMLKKLIIRKIFDDGWDHLSNVPHGHIDWKTYIYYDKKVLVGEKTGSSFDEINKTTLIKGYGKNKLKITTKTSVKSDIYVKGSKQNQNSSLITKISYVKTKLNPSQYYLKVYKPRMLKYVPKNYTFETAYGVLKDSKIKLYWNVVSHMNKEFVKDKITIHRGFSLDNLTHDKITIEIYSKNKLKMIYKLNKTTELEYINTKLLPLDYYYQIYKPEMSKIFDKSTIRQITFVD